MSIFNTFFPSHEIISAYHIPYEELYEKGKRGVIFDIDNTLVPHDADADENALALMQRLKNIGYDICFVSNNDRERVERFNEKIGAHFIFKAHKPSTKGYFEAMEQMGTDKNSTIFAGDQLFTDTWGAKRAGIESFRVVQMNPKEEIQIRLKRILEIPILRAFRRTDRKPNLLLIGTDDGNTRENVLKNNKDKIYVDVNEIIEWREKKSLREILENCGEKYYYRKVKQLLKLLSKMKGNMIIRLDEKSYNMFNKKRFLKSLEDGKRGQG